ncbi:hypothetical protein H6P81_003706 [Aristolochia fimbriata]|uniref:TPR repeat-containing thioredoxin TDX n=1 Tax=Aristolochia fimbriata TaxID=158543 RepID=A0AAV7FHD4_ARIFI|nr:hypothetical protein H6P81_003706 [Aristolochia fimbriata]
MDAAKIEQLKLFVDQCKLNPSILDDPSLVFFKDYLQSLGGQIPHRPKTESTTSGDDFKDFEDADVDDEIVESDIELDGDVVEEDDDPPQQMGDPSVEVTEEKRDAAQMSKAEAMNALSEDKVDEAIEHLTEAIMSNPTSAILYAARAAIFVKMNKPNAAIRDADAALKINADSAKGYKARGMARSLLGQWEGAAKDLHLASKLDYDDEINSALKKVEPNVQKIEVHRKKYERLRKEKEIRKAEYERKRQQAEAKHSEAQSADALQEGTVISIHSTGELDTKFKAASSLSRLAIMYFTASWCGPCRFISPLYSSLAEKYPKVVFLKIDIDEVRSVAARWNVSSVPTFFFIKDGKEVDRVVGADKNGLERKIAQHAGSHD